MNKTTEDNNLTSIAQKLEVDTSVPGESQCFDVYCQLINWCKKKLKDSDFSALCKGSNISAQLLNDLESRTGTPDVAYDKKLLENLLAVLKDLPVRFTVFTGGRGFSTEQVEGEEVLSGMRNYCLGGKLLLQVFNPIKTEGGREFLGNCEQPPVFLLVESTVSTEKPYIIYSPSMNWPSDCANEITPKSDSLKDKLKQSPRRYNEAAKQYYISLYKYFVCKAAAANISIDTKLIQKLDESGWHSSKEHLAGLGVVEKKTLVDLWVNMIHMDEMKIQNQSLPQCGDVIMSESNGGRPATIFGQHISRRLRGIGAAKSNSKFKLPLASECVETLPNGRRRITTLREFVANKSGGPHETGEAPRIDALVDSSNESLAREAPNTVTRHSPHSSATARCTQRISTSQDLNLFLFFLLSALLATVAGKFIGARKRKGRGRRRGEATALNWATPQPSTPQPSTPQPSFQHKKRAATSDVAVCPGAATVRDLKKV
eukprot:GHVT01013288.1.p1 GENE.GHVT01013288.1~~GHVT01013288.1.p1  ORF type:complete len:487 (-),score=47.25 GHVT01013288.1:2290-3750(-)